MTSLGQDETDAKLKNIFNFPKISYIDKLHTKIKRYQKPHTNKNKPSQLLTGIIHFSSQPKSGYYNICFGMKRNLARGSGKRNTSVLIVVFHP